MKMKPLILAVTDKARRIYSRPEGYQSACQQQG